jgi:ectoine hydroxylase-related dioxygenase (phytanoyl-CoA dioxygenase family)
MKLTQEQLWQYREQGFVVLPSAFSAEEIRALKAELPRVLADDTPARIVEARTRTVRSVYGSHRTHERFRHLSEDARLVEPAMQVVGSDVYIYQFKINVKAAFEGDVWEWHQDYIFWREEDGMPAPRVTNVALFLDEVTEFNGPMFFIPGSHRRGVIEVEALDGNAGGGMGSMAPAWISNVTAKLKYSLERETVAELTRRNGLACPKGPAGSVLLFDSNVAHSSPNNISPFDRMMVISTYNSVENIPQPIGPRRPDFLVSADYEPVRPVHPILY